MSESDPKGVVDAYLAAIAARDFAAARGYLSDRGFRYRSPVSRYDDPDVFISNIERIGPILVDLKTRFASAEGATVCHVFDVTVSITEYETYATAQLSEVQDGRIRRIEIIFDASDYRRMFGD